MTLNETVSRFPGNDPVMGNDTPSGPLPVTRPLTPVMGNDTPSGPLPVTRPLTPVMGNDTPSGPLPVTRPLTPVMGNDLFVDLAALLAGDLPPAPAPSVLYANDGIALFYAGQINLVFGDPESGKTWVCLAAVAEALRTGRKAAVVDLDHNGPESTVNRLLDLGAPVDAVTDRGRFRYVEPSDPRELLAVVEALVDWETSVVVLDSLGELLPLFGASSNDADDFTKVHARVLKPLARCGSAVLVIDHLAKGSDSRAMGSTGTAAKKRAVGGVSLRVSVAEQFAPGRGGSCHLSIAKDRHGGLRAHRSSEDREPLAGTFRLFGDDSAKAWDLFAPAPGERTPEAAADEKLVQRLLEMDPAPTNVAQAREALRCRMALASKAFAEYKKRRDEQSLPVTRPLTPVMGNACENTAPEGLF